ncbi:LolA family protein [Flavobacterium aciduliphilum]|uniref:Outer membrane lipoprotein carrier protein n=1 Tax=Flavobacterium aciduliphilum TaxID=1101402 RepID=A0A328YE93_9FLAO|nr:outer membrane lipoprotein carrier protein LolA [Flavobacterium aciduliphilum]RAR71534.1 outer membrane lipoprotein carrier protein [Flavobacterium aciduliphilum]
MRIKIFTILFLALTKIVFSQEQKMSVTEIAEFKATIEKESKTINTIKTDFIQYKHLDFLSKDIETSGKMSFKTPNLLNWQYTKPYNYSIVFKSNKIFINDQGKKSIIDAGSSKIFEKINKMIVGSVSGNMFDDKEFAISYYKTKEFYIAKLSPKTKEISKYIQQIDLYFPINDVIVSLVKLNEPSGDFTKIVFKNKILNAKIDDSVFSN